MTISSIQITESGIIVDFVHVNGLENCIYNEATFEADENDRALKQLLFEFHAHTFTKKNSIENIDEVIFFIAQKSSDFLKRIEGWNSRNQALTKPVLIRAIVKALVQLKSDRARQYLNDFLKDLLVGWNSDNHSAYRDIVDILISHTWEFFSKNAEDYLSLLRDVKHFYIFKLLQEFGSDFKDNSQFFPSFVQGVEPQERKVLIKNILYTHRYAPQNAFRIALFNIPLLDALLKQLSLHDFSEVIATDTELQYVIQILKSDHTDNTVVTEFLGQQLRKVIDEDQYHLLRRFSNHIITGSLPTDILNILSMRVVELDDREALDLIMKNEKYLLTTKNAFEMSRQGVLNFFFANKGISENDTKKLLKLVSRQELCENLGSWMQCSAMKSGDFDEMVQDAFQVFEKNDVILSDSVGVIKLYAIGSIGEMSEDCSEIFDELVLTPAIYWLIKERKNDLADKIKGKMSILQKFKFGEHLEISELDDLIHQDPRCETLLLKKPPYLEPGGFTTLQFKRREESFYRFNKALDQKWRSALEALNTNELKVIMGPLTADIFSFSIRYYYPETYQYLIDSLPFAKCIRINAPIDEYSHRWPFLSFDEKSSIFWVNQGRMDVDVAEKMSFFASTFQTELDSMLQMRLYLIVTTVSIVFMLSFLLLPIASELASVGVSLAIAFIIALVMWHSLVESLGIDIELANLKANFPASSQQSF